MKGNHLGTLAERLAEYQKLKVNDMKITMLESRLSYLHSENICEGEEVDNILEKLFTHYSNLKWSLGLED